MSEAKIQPLVWAFAGGKGGVGKSLVCASTAIELARRRLRVVAVDCDLGAANLHTLLGLLHPEKTLVDFFGDPEPSLQGVLLPTQVPGLSLISGAGALLESAHPNPAKHRALVSALLNLDADVVILDLGAGAHYPTLDYFALSGQRILVTGPEPTAIQNAYGFLKAAVYRRLELGIGRDPAIRHLLRRATQHRGSGRLETLDDLMGAIAAERPEYRGEASRLVSRTAPRLVINQASPADEKRVHGALGVVCGRYLGLKPTHVVTLPEDRAVRTSVRSMKPVMLSAPNSPFSQKIARLVDGLLSLASESDYALVDQPLAFNASVLNETLPATAQVASGGERDAQEPGSLSDVLTNLQRQQPTMDESQPDVANAVENPETTNKDSLGEDASPETGRPGPLAGSSLHEVDPQPVEDNVGQHEGGKQASDAAQYEVAEAPDVGPYNEMQSRVEREETGPHASNQDASVTAQETEVTEARGEVTQQRSNDDAGAPSSETSVTASQTADEADVRHPDEEDIEPVIDDHAPSALTDSSDLAQTLAEPSDAGRADVENTGTVDSDEGVSVPMEPSDSVPTLAEPSDAGRTDIENTGTLASNEGVSVPMEPSDSVPTLAGQSDAGRTDVENTGTLASDEGVSVPMEPSDSVPTFAEQPDGASASVEDEERTPADDDDSIQQSTESQVSGRANQLDGSGRDNQIHPESVKNGDLRLSQEEAHSQGAVPSREPELKADFNAGGVEEDISNGMADALAQQPPTQASSAPMLGIDGESELDTAHPPDPMAQATSDDPVVSGFGESPGATGLDERQIPTTGHVAELDSEVRREISDVPSEPTLPMGAVEPPSEAEITPNDEIGDRPQSVSSDAGAAPKDSEITKIEEPVGLGPEAAGHTDTEPAPFETDSSSARRPHSEQVTPVGSDPNTLDGDPETPFGSGKQEIMSQTPDTISRYVQPHFSGDNEAPIPDVENPGGPSFGNNSTDDVNDAQVDKIAPDAHRPSNGVEGFEPEISSASRGSSQVTGYPDEWGDSDDGSEANADVESLMPGLPPSSQVEGAESVSTSGNDALQHKQRDEASAFELDGDGPSLLKRDPSMSGSSTPSAVKTNESESSLDSHQDNLGEIQAEAKSDILDVGSAVNEAVSQGTESFSADPGIEHSANESQGTAVKQSAVQTGVSSARNQDAEQLREPSEGSQESQHWEEESGEEAPSIERHLLDQSQDGEKSNRTSPANDSATSSGSLVDAASTPIETDLMSPPESKRQEPVQDEQVPLHAERDEARLAEKEPDAGYFLQAALEGVSIEPDEPDPSFMGDDINFGAYQAPRDVAGPSRIGKEDPEESESNVAPTAPPRSPDHQDESLDQPSSSNGELSPEMETGSRQSDREPDGDVSSEDSAIGHRDKKEEDQSFARNSRPDSRTDSRDEVNPETGPLENMRHAETPPEQTDTEAHDNQSADGENIDHHLQDLATDEANDMPRTSRGAERNQGLATHSVDEPSMVMATDNELGRSVEAANDLEMPDLSGVPANLTQGHNEPPTSDEALDDSQAQHQPESPMARESGSSFFEPGGLTDTLAEPSGTAAETEAHPPLNQDQEEVALLTDEASDSTHGEPADVIEDSTSADDPLTGNQHSDDAHDLTAFSSAEVDANDLGEDALLDLIDDENDFFSQDDPMDDVQGSRVGSNAPDAGTDDLLAALEAVQGSEGEGERIKSSELDLEHRSEFKASQTDLMDVDEADSGEMEFGQLDVSNEDEVFGDLNSAFDDAMFGRAGDDMGEGMAFPESSEHEGGELEDILNAEHQGQASGEEVAVSHPIDGMASDSTSDEKDFFASDTPQETQFQDSEEQPVNAESIDDGGHWDFETYLEDERAIMADLPPEKPAGDPKQDLRATHDFGSTNFSARMVSTERDEDVIPGRQDSRERELRELDDELDALELQLENEELASPKAQMTAIREIQAALEQAPQPMENDFLDTNESLARHDEVNPGMSPRFWAALRSGSEDGTAVSTDAVKPPVEVWDDDPWDMVQLTGREVAFETPNPPSLVERQEPHAQPHTTSQLTGSDDPLLNQRPVPGVNVFSDPPGHPVIRLDELVDTAEGAFNLQTADLAPQKAAICTSIFRGGRRLKARQHSYEDLVGPAGVVGSAAQVPEMVETLHAEARRLLLDNGIMNLDWEMTSSGDEA